MVILSDFKISQKLDNLFTVLIKILEILLGDPVCKIMGINI